MNTFLWLAIGLTILVIVKRWDSLVEILLKNHGEGINKNSKWINGGLVIIGLSALTYYSITTFDWDSVYLLNHEISASRKLVFVLLLFYIAHKINEISKTKNVPKEIFSGLVFIVGFLTILTLGQFQSLGSRINNSSDEASCEVNSFQEKCVLLKEEKERKQKLEAISEQKVFAQPVPQPTHAIIENCMGDFAKLRGCERVIFRGDSYQRIAKKGLCVTYTPASQVSSKFLGNDLYSYTADKGVQAYLFDIAIGESYQNFTCK